MSSTTSSSTPSLRLTSLDQFRGYTMVGMIVVNFLGAYKLVVHPLLTHSNNYCSYADTIMPHFFFAAGFAMRLSLARRLEQGGKMPWGRAIRRIFGLALVAIAWYGFEASSGIIKSFETKPAAEVLLFLFKHQLFQTLLHIAATSLWILPVITAPWKTRLAYAIGSGLLHVFITWAFNYEWVHSQPTAIDGGPLGFLSWSIPTLAGTIACDAVRAWGTSATRSITISGIALMVLGWVMSMPTVLYNVRPVTAETTPADASIVSPEATPPTNPAVPVETAPRKSSLDPQKFPPDPVIPTSERLRAWDGTIVEPPFVPPPGLDRRKWNYWMMSQQCITLSYSTFSAGLSLVVYALFLWLCDGLHFSLGIFRTLGTNSLAAYILSSLASGLIRPHFPPRETASLTAAITALVCVILIVERVCLFLERRGWYIRV